MYNRGHLPIRMSPVDSKFVVLLMINWITLSDPISSITEEIMSLIYSVVILALETSNDFKNIAPLGEYALTLINALQSTSLHILGVQPVTNQEFLILLIYSSTLTIKFGINFL